MPSDTKQQLLDAISDALMIAAKEKAQIERDGGGRRGYDPSDLLRLAEAYAWSVSPNQPHGAQ